MTLNRWQKFWKGVDEARLVVRILLVIGFFSLFQYIWFVTAGFFSIVAFAQSAGDDAGWAQLVPVLTAVTAFVVGNLKIIVDFVTKVWLDYRNSGTDWEQNGKGDE